MRRWLVVGTLLVVVVLAVAGATGGPAAAEPSAPSPGLFQFEGQDSGVWPYLSPSESFRKRSPVNVIVKGEAASVVRALRERSGTTWRATPPSEGHANASVAVPETVNLSGTTVAWSDTVGTPRYAYVTDGEDSQWIRESEQLHHGDYYGYRTHIRLYASPDPDEQWVAMQVHTEHFDWFTLRHAVDGVERGQRAVEQDFMDAPYVERVWRVHLNNDGPSDADGWATVVELFALPGLLVGTLSMRRFWRRRLRSLDRERLRAVRDRLGPEHALLVGGLLALVFGVRAGGIALERHVTALSMHAIAALLYPFLAVGLPLATVWLAGRLERRLDAAVTASGGLAAAVVLDYSYLGIDVLPVEVVLQRATLVVVLGVVAAGAARPPDESRRRDLLTVGLLSWVLLLAATLLQWV